VELVLDELLKVELVLAVLVLLAAVMESFISLLQLLDVMGGAV
jgi:hypothetical protein